MSDRSISKPELIHQQFYILKLNICKIWTIILFKPCNTYWIDSNNMNLKFKMWKPDPPTFSHCSNVESTVELVLKPWITIQRLVECFWILYALCRWCFVFWKSKWNQGPFLPLYIKAATTLTITSSRSQNQMGKIGSKNPPKFSDHYPLANGFTFSHLV